MPINFVTHPGVSLTPACFADGRYEDEAATRCFSNLLAVGFKRFVVDVYWDASRDEWSLCPAGVSEPALSESNGTSSTTSSSTATATAEALPRSSSEGESIDERALGLRNPSPDQSTGDALAPRQETSATTASPESPSLETAASVTEDRVTTSSAVTAPSETAGTSQELPSSDSYTCAPTVNLSLLVTILADYLEQTGDTLQASLLYVLFNVHITNSETSTGDAVEELGLADLPGPNQLLSTVLNQSLSDYLYTPTLLDNDRANLNASWYDVADDSLPDAFYLETDVGPDNIHRSENGWPNERYVEFEQSKRLLVGFGDIDSQMNNYNVSGESTTLFGPNILESARELEFSEDGTVTRGCLVNQETKNSIDDDASWAVSTGAGTPDSDSTALDGATEEAAAITKCGISPILSQTLLNKTADEDVSAYLAFTTGAIWSWAPGEPRNITEGASCALLDGTNGGRWVTADCSETHYAACRSPGLPYVWGITNSPVPYASSADACPGGTAFSVPRTALENSYLLATLAEQAEDERRRVWVDFNSLDVPGCWVSGQDSQCPYRDNQDEIRARAVLVPVIAAVVVFVLAMLTLFVKCNNNRLNSKRRRRRKQDGWDYEGVPA